MSYGVTRSPIELSWTAKNEFSNRIWYAGKVVFDWHLHEDRYSQNPNNPASPMNWDCINRIVNPQRDKQAGEEKINESSKGSNDA